MPEPDFVIRANDTASILYSTLKDDAGAAVDIEGATVRFHMAAINTAGSPLLDAVATNDQVLDGSDGSKGQVSYAWTAPDTVTSGFFAGEWQVTYNGGSVETFPNTGYVLIYISPEVA